MERRASRRKYHYIYKTTCLVTNRYYIGMHSTDNLKDGYKGSGTLLWHSMNKYGRDKHNTEILEFLDNRKDLKLREKEIVNEELINDKMCMNLRLGGVGGLSSPEHALKFHRAGGKSTGRKNILKINSNSKYTKNRWKNLPNWTGRKHTQETKDKIGKANSKHQKGKCNSQYGTRWITNGTKSKKIKKDDSIPDGWRFGRK